MTRDIRLCLIEDDQIMGESLSDRFRIEGFSSLWCRDGATAIRALRDQNFDLVVSDMQLGDMGGDEVFSWARANLPLLPPFVFITGYGSVDQAVHLIRQGARDYISKPFDLDALIFKIREWVPEDRTAGRTAYPLGVSPIMQSIAVSLSRIANAAATVLVVGESGVGKERVAQQLHAARVDSANRPFVPVNCAAIAETLLEAEIFGYEKGAFTGAARTKPGVFEQANGGTLFLDEVGEMPLSMQVKLLRVIQERRVTRVGGETSMAVDLLLVCATNRDLRKLVTEGAFREDLYYRINVVQIKVPPLRERQEDIPWFAEHFLAEIVARTGESRRLHPSAEAAMQAYPWPGNLRELHHTIERAAIMSASEIIPTEALFPDAVPTPQAALAQPAAADTGSEPASLGDYLRVHERRYIIGALEEQGWQIAQTAARLGISRKNLWEKMRKLDIDAPSAE